MIAVVAVTAVIAVIAVLHTLGVSANKSRTLVSKRRRKSCKRGIFRIRGSSALKLKFLIKTFRKSSTLRMNRRRQRRQRRPRRPRQLLRRHLIGRHFASYELRLFMDGPKFLRQLLPFTSQTFVSLKSKLGWFHRIFSNRKIKLETIEFLYSQPLSWEVTSVGDASTSRGRQEVQ